MKRPIVFISYSWDSQEHQDWVLKLSKDLIEKYKIGIDVLAQCGQNIKCFENPNYTKPNGGGNCGIQLQKK